MRIRNFLKLLTPGTPKAFLELRRLKRLPRRQPTVSHLQGFPMEIPDAASFLVMRHEIFERGMYTFRPTHSCPRIIDGGANIGMGLIFFKREWPGSRVTCFEPDPFIFSVLERNARRAGCNDVELVNKALWSSSTFLTFKSDNADAGRVVQEEVSAAKVPAVRLRDYLDEPIDLLKLDIEGAEWEVLRDSADKLDNVQNLFVECHSFDKHAQDLHAILELLHAGGFRYFVEPVNRAPQPFINRPNCMGMDLQVNVYASRGW